MCSFRSRVSTVAGLLLLTSATLVASFHGMWFYLHQGSDVRCGGHVRGDGWNYFTLQIRIYGPTGALLASDAVAADPYRDPIDLSTTLATPAVGSGTYTCIVIWDDGSMSDTEEDTLVVP